MGRRHTTPCRREQRVLVPETRRLPRVGDGVGSARLRRDPDRAACRARARIANPLRSGPQAARTTRSSFRAAGARPRRHRGAPAPPYDLVEGGRGVELREQPSDIREPLGELSRPPLALEELSALERTRAAPVRWRARARSSSEKVRSSRKSNHERVLLPTARHRCRDKRAVALFR